jgi:branched-chain amino acid transport system permease protein
MRRYAPVVVLTAIWLVLPFVFASGYHYRVACLVWTAALAVIGLNLLMGFAGQVSLGHAAFGGMGAYAVAVLPTHFATPPLAAFAIGVAAAGLLAFLVGRPILKLKGHYLAVATLGMGILIYMVFLNEARFTGGPDGMAVPRLELFGTRIRAVETWYWISGGAMVLGAFFAANLVDSPTGRALRAIHDSEIAAQVVGVDVARAKLTVFVISAMYAAVAGALLAWLSAFINPDVAGFLHSIELVTMVVLGGMGSIVGSVVGAAVLTILPQALTAFADYKHLLIGLILMVVMIFMRDGVVPTLVRLWRRRKP